MFGRWAWTLPAVFCVMLAGCGPPRVTSPTNSLAGARFDIPVYPGAKITASGSPTTFHRGDPNAPTAYDGRVWDLSFGDPVEKVVAFYDARLREARRVAPEANSDVPADDPNEADAIPVAIFRYKPSGAADDEEVTIEIYDRRIEIAQVTRQQ
jgi:hypothetical protein